MTTAIAKREEQELVVPTPRGILTTEVLREAAEQRKLLGQYVKEQMIEGTDYGKIPGTDKPTLLKPGAEKLVELFRCTPKFTLVKAVEDFDRGLFAYTFRVRLFQRDAQVVLAEGFGSANSREARYRWRQASRKCPACQKEAIIQGKPEFGGGWICFAKKGGCGAKYMLGDQAIVGQEVGRVENDDIASQVNAILKVAKKRCLVDGSLALARVSDLFTQDMEEHAHEEQAQEKPAAKAAPQKAAAKPNGKSSGKPWERLVIYADAHKFDRGEGNKLLWEVAARTVPGKKWPQWTDDDYRAIEFAIVEAKEAEIRTPDAVQPAGAPSEENDIPF